MTQRPGRGAGGPGPVACDEPSAAPADDPALARLGGTAGNVAALDAVLAQAETAGRGVVVSWARSRAARLRRGRRAPICADGFLLDRGGAGRCDDRVRRKMPTVQ